MVPVTQSGGKRTRGLRRLESSGATYLRFSPVVAQALVGGRPRSLGGRAAAARKAKRSSGGGGAKERGSKNLCCFWLTACSADEVPALPSRFSISPSAQKEVKISSDWTLGMLWIRRDLLCNLVSRMSCLFRFPPWVSFTEVLLPPSKEMLLKGPSNLLPAPALEIRPKKLAFSFLLGRKLTHYPETGFSGANYLRCTEFPPSPGCIYLFARRSALWPPAPGGVGATTPLLLKKKGYKDAPPLAAAVGMRM